VTAAPQWLSRQVVDAIHEDQRQQHGGNAGVLNDGSIESALARARHRFEYTGAGLLECAACYVFGIAKNHGHADANKRTAYMVGLTFLRVNGHGIDASPEDVLQLMLDVVTDIRDESAITEWLRVRATKIGAPSV
jgi:death-on-curing protein